MLFLPLNLALQVLTTIFEFFDVSVILVLFVGLVEIIMGLWTIINFNFLFAVNDLIASILRYFQFIVVDQTLFFFFDILLLLNTKWIKSIVQIILDCTLAFILLCVWGWWWFMLIFSIIVIILIFIIDESKMFNVFLNFLLFTMNLITTKHCKVSTNCKVSKSEKEKN